MSSGNALNISFVSYGAFFAVFPVFKVFIPIIVRWSCINVRDWEEHKWSAGGQHWGHPLFISQDMPNGCCMDAASCNVTFGNLRSYHELHHLIIDGWWCPVKNPEKQIQIEQTGLIFRAMSSIWRNLLLTWSRCDPMETVFTRGKQLLSPGKEVANSK